jgi:hypothetical protein
MEKNNRAVLRELIRRTEEQHIVEDVYSAKNMEDAADDDVMTPAEQGFMLGFTS